MKYKLNISFLFTFFIAISTINAQQAIKYQARYLLTFQQDSADVNSQKSEMMLLQLGDTGSMFLSENHLIRDSILNSLQSMEEKMSLLTQKDRLPKFYFKEKIYKNYLDKNISVLEKVLKTHYVYNQPFSDFKWEIQEEQKEVLGFKSQKATLQYGGRQWTAWFTSEIPIPEGPYKFYGLPGLIVKITDDKNHYDYTLQRFSKVTDKTMNEIPLDANKVTLEEFKKVKGNFEENPLKSLEQLGITIDIDAGDLKKLKKQGKKQRNNAIELN
ncbi:GLPGLI family protein [Flavobacteriaceae bacterium Ap0902]|nr:GLPGLI family protein [Flavobacteriaceae bacterium Ap0902]